MTASLKHSGWHWCLLAVLAVTGIVCGARLGLVRSYGSDVPYMDQWDAQARLLYIPHAEGRLSAADFWEPHNEHRIVLTKLLGSGLTYGNRQWDPLLEMSVNSVLYAALAGLLAALALCQLPQGETRARILVWVWSLAVIALAFSLPFAWENTLQGFQSQFVLAVLAGVGGIWLAAPAAPWSTRWLAGVGVGLSGLAVMSSGFLTLAALVPVLAIRQWWCERRWSWRGASAMGLLLLLCVVGMTLVQHVPGHDVLRASSVGEWFRAWLNCLSWPANRWLGWALLVQSPTLLILYRALRRRELVAVDAVMLGLVAWSWLQLAALAYGRGHDMLVASPRYMDLYALLLVVNAIALARLWLFFSMHGWVSVGIAFWSGVVGWGLQQQTTMAYSSFLDGFAGQRLVERQHLRAFIRSGDWRRFQHIPQEQLPHPSADTLRLCLTHPGVRTLLPVGLRPAVEIKPSAESFGFNEVEPSGAGCPDLRVWAARSGPARFVSEPLSPSTLPMLRMTFAGARDLPVSVLLLEAADGTRVPLQLQQPHFAEGRWQTAHLAVPAGHGLVRLIVDIPVGAPGFSFAQPVEIGRWSFYTHHVRKCAPYIVWVSLGLGCLAMVMLIRGAGGLLGVSVLREWRSLLPSYWPLAKAGVPFVFWYSGGALVLFVACLPVLWPASFSAPMAIGSAGQWAVRIGLFALTPLFVLSLFRTYEGSRRERWFLIVLALVGACFCEHIAHQFVDKGHYFGGPVNSDWQKMLQERVIALDPVHVPHSYRFFSHGIVELFSWLGGGFEVGRAAYRLLFNALLCGAILRFARLFLPVVYSAATLVLLLCLYPVTVAFFAGQFVDPASHLSFVACFYFIHRGFEPGLAPSILVGIFAKESVAVMAAARLFGPGKRFRSLVVAGLYLGLALGAILTIRFVVNHGAMRYNQISGVGVGHLLANLKPWDVWGPQLALSLGVLLPGAVLGWRLMDRNYRLMAVLVSVSLIVSSLMFSWLHEARNFFPAMILLAIVNLRYVQCYIERDGSRR